MCWSATTTSALLAGSFALLGVGISQAAMFFQERAKRNHARAVLLREKYEELASSLQSSMASTGCLLLAEGKKELLEAVRDHDANRCRLLCGIYFPELVDASSLYLSERMNLYGTITQLCTPDSGQMFISQAKDNPQFKDAITKYDAAKEAFSNSIYSNVKTYAIA